CGTGLPKQVVVLAWSSARPVHLLLHRGSVPLDKSEVIEVTVNTNGVEFLPNHLLAHCLGLFKAIELHETKCQVRTGNAQARVKAQGFVVFFDSLLVLPN